MQKCDLHELMDRVQNVAAEKILSIKNCDDETALEIIEESAFETCKELDLEELSILIRRLSGKMRGELGGLSYLLDDRSINEIMINGPDEIFIEKKGRTFRLNDRFESRKELERCIRKIAAGVHREINDLNPILDARLKDGSRVNAVLDNIAIGGPVVTVRRFSEGGLSLDNMVKLESLTEECAEDLKDMVKGGFNIFVSGGTSSGKTSLLNALSEFIPDEERIVVIEDSAELNFRNADNLVHLECKKANTAGSGSIDLDKLIKTSLRMRPDRIIVGEVRGKEVSSMLQALNTGHSGMSTGHGNSVRGMLRRLEAMYISGFDIPLDAVRTQIIEAIDILVHLARLADGSRKVIEIEELIGYSDGKYILRTIYRLDKNMHLVYTGTHLEDDIKLRLRGIENERLQDLQTG